MNSGTKKVQHVSTRSDIVSNKPENYAQNKRDLINKITKLQLMDYKYFVENNTNNIYLRPTNKIQTNNNECECSRSINTT